MKNVILLCLLASFTGCASQGERIQTSAVIDGQMFTLVAYDQKWPDFLIGRDNLKLNLLIKGDSLNEQRVFAAVDGTEALCRKYVDIARPDNWVIVLANGVVYGVAGTALGLAAQVFDGVSSGDYAVYGGVAGAANGAANGVISLGGQTYTFENCGREILDQLPDLNVRVLQKSPY